MRRLDLPFDSGGEQILDESATRLSAMTSLDGLKRLAD
jgi:hypothetical protein